MFAVVDVETTGGYASGHRMTEIAIVLHDGNKIVDRFDTLLNPQSDIPFNIQTLTGITPEMVEDAPLFKDVAPKIRKFLGDHIFVAHNVNFDYSFVRSAFAGCGIDYNPKRLCTVRYARKVVKGLRSYSLGNLCKHYQVTNRAAHRAWGDAEATAEILGLILESDLKGEWQYMVKKNSGEFNLPVNLPSEDYQNLPSVPGVYYFLDQSGKPIYIGKASNLKKRVATHFISDKETRRSQAFKREIHNIKYEPTGSELLASLLEDHEIRHYWPKYNRAQKNPKRRYGVYVYENQVGVTSMAVNRITTQKGFLREFYSRHEALGWMHEMVLKFRVDPCRCGFPGRESAEISPEDHNQRMQELVTTMTHRSDTYLIKTSGRDAEEDGFAYVDNGYLAGIGFVPRDYEISSHRSVLDFLRELRSSVTTQAILSKILESGTHPVIML